MSRSLYHGTSNTRHYDELRVQDHEQEKNGICARWLFATHRRDQAYAYALPRSDGFLTILARDAQETGPLALFRMQTSQDFAAEPVQGNVYIIPSDGFNRVAQAPREWVRNQSLKLTAENHQVVPIHCAEDVMSAGVQIFTLRSHTDASLIDRMHPNFLFKQGCLIESVADILNRPDTPLIWENLKAASGVNTALLQQLKGRPGPSCT